MSQSNEPAAPGPAPAPGPGQSPEAWSAAAPAYVRVIGTWTGWAEEALRRVAPRPTDEVLDVATGTGTLALLAARRVARVVAVDFAPGMVEELRGRMQAEGIANVDPRVMDAQSLELEDASFDAAFCLFGFMFFPDRARAFRELCRVLRPGGRAAVATWAPLDRRPLMKVAFEVIAEALPGVPVPSKGDLQVEQECVAEMSAAGFREVEVHRFTDSVRIDSPEHFLDGVTRGSAPFAAMRKKMGPEAWRAAEERLLEVARTKIPAEGASFAAEALITIGTR